jgi:uncharacterized protein YqeY
MPPCWTSSARTGSHCRKRCPSTRRSASAAEQLRSEIDILARWLPKGLDEDALRVLVRERLGALGITDAKQMGRLLGDLMKTHKGQIEAADVKRIAEELLSSSA